MKNKIKVVFVIYAVVLQASHSVGWACTTWYPNHCKIAGCHQDPDYPLELDDCNSDGYCDGCGSAYLGFYQTCLPVSAACTYDTWKTGIFGNGPHTTVSDTVETSKTSGLGCGGG